MSGLSSETVIRVARNRWRCQGDGSASPKHSDGCTVVIKEGDRHAEYLGESSAYQSGSRHCMACAHEFGYVEGGGS
jgi:hypothetical protein